MTEVRRLKGIIKTVNSRGFGFITTPEGIDLFFHFSELKGMNWKELVTTYIIQVNPRIEVTFQVDPTATKAPRAINVELVKESV